MPGCRNRGYGNGNLYGIIGNTFLGQNKKQIYKVILNEVFAHFDRLS